MFRAAKRLADDRIIAPPDMRACWTTPAWNAFSGDDALQTTMESRLQRDRNEIVPWLQKTRALAGSHILEVGCGTGSSTIALAEQGAHITGLDLDPEAMSVARARTRAHNLAVEYVEANATEVGRFHYDWLIYWAVLEHMTVPERLETLRLGWNALPAGGLLTVIETPNRLWYQDSHTSLLPFYMWLPDELAFQYARHSPRAGFADRYGTLTDEQLLHFQRRGRGVSFHEFHLAIGHELDVVACMQLDRRRSNPMRAAAWRLSPPGRYEALLGGMAPEVPRAFFQPFLYLTLRKP
jgi:SAM-dependent methyltransferase